jgi:hypothetical protein
VGTSVALGERMPPPDTILGALTSAALAVAKQE